MSGVMHDPQFLIVFDPLHRGFVTLKELHHYTIADGEYLQHLVVSLVQAEFDALFWSK